jgi:tellurite resistance protein TerC
VFHALHVNEVPFINGGQPIEWIPEIPIWFSLGFILLTIAVATILSLRKTKRDGVPHKLPATTAEAEADER